MKYSDNYNPECWYKGVCEECVGEDRCIKYTRMRLMMANSNIPVAKRVPIHLNIPKVDKTAYERLKDIRNNIYNFVYDGKSLYITSEIVGNGKTSSALKLLMGYFDELLDDDRYDDTPVGIFIHVPTLLVKLKDFKTTDYEFEKLKKDLMTADLVVWDDIASTDMSAYDLSQLTVFIDNRIMNELSNIYTGNIISREDMSSALGARLTSRIWNSKTEVVEFHGGDRR